MKTMEEKYGKLKQNFGEKIKHLIQLKMKKTIYRAQKGINYINHNKEGS